jgi:hypothetical protein
MQLTKSSLKQIIKEEIQSLLQEQIPEPDEDTGRWIKFKTPKLSGKLLGSRVMRESIKLLNSQEASNAIKQILSLTGSPSEPDYAPQKWINTVAGRERFQPRKGDRFIEPEWYLVITYLALLDQYRRAKQKGAQKLK